MQLKIYHETLIHIVHVPQVNITVKIIQMESEGHAFLQDDVLLGKNSLHHSGHHGNHGAYCLGSRTQPPAGLLVLHHQYVITGVQMYKIPVNDKRHKIYSHHMH